MFGEIPKLFDRDFFIAYFLPALLFVIANLLLIERFGLIPFKVSLIQTELVSTITSIGIITALVGVFLSITNKEVLGLREGYGKFNPARLFLWMEKRRFERLSKRLEELDHEYSSYLDKGEDIPPEIYSLRAQIILNLAERFPDRSEFLLPTAFGNSVRAFEVYPRIMYGLEYVVAGWNALLTVIPKEFREIVNAAKAHTDFWVNIWILSLTLIIEYIIFAITTKQLIILWVPLCALIICLFASSRSVRAAIEWGALVKISFDIYLPELSEKLKFPPPETTEQEREVWTRFSQALIYREPSVMISRAPTSKKGDEKTPTK